MDDLQQLIARHMKRLPKDSYLQLYQAEIYLRDERYELADRAFTSAFATIKDPGVEARFRHARVNARYQSGDVVGAYRDIGPHREVFQQLAGQCWADKKADDLAKLIEVHIKNEPDDSGVANYRWRVKITGEKDLVL